MKWWLLMTVAVAGAGCATTTTVGSPSSDGTQRALAENASSDASIETTDRGLDQPELVVVASSPTDVRFHAGNEVVVPMTPVRRASIRPAVHQGMIIGAVIGVATGAMSGYASDENQRAHPEANCDPLCGTGLLLGTPILGAIGLGLGAAVGTVVGLLNRL